MRKTVLSGVIFVGLIIAGFIFLLRGCLSRYDERSALAPTLYFEKDGRTVLFAIVKFEKTTSYSQNGGFTNKTVSISYFIQNNDAVTGEKLASKKIRHHSDIKNYPVEIVAGLHNQAWIFMGELMIFDPFTLELIADLKSLEDKNPSLRGKFPAERRYYDYHPADSSLYITMKDGSRWQLNTQTLLASPADDKTDKDDESPEVISLERQVKQNEDEQDTLMEQKLRRPSRMLSAREISNGQYQKIINGFSEERALLYKKRDSLQQLLTIARKQKSSYVEMKRIIENLQSKSGVHFSQIKSNMDTVDGKWYGLYTKAELDKLYDRVQYQAAHEEPSRRRFYTSVYAPDKSGDYVIDKKAAIQEPENNYFLNGGFLLNKNTGKPIRLRGPNSFLIVYKEQVGNDGTILLSRVTMEGKMIWIFDTRLKEWTDWILSRESVVRSSESGQRLFVLGADNKEISSGEISAFYSIDLLTGKAVKYDYFSDEMK